MQENRKDKLKLTARQKVALIVKSRVFEITILILVLLYVLIVFAYFLIDDLGFTNQERNEYLLTLNIIELIILIVFLIEITFNTIAYGFSFYFRTKLLLFDAIVIIISFVLVIIELAIQDESKNPTLSLIARIVRGVFRFLRIFILFRKVSNISFIC